MKKLLPLLISVLILQACGNPAEAVTPTNPATTVPAAESITVESTITEEPNATQEPIVHTTIPSEGTTERANAHDNEQSTSFKNKNVTDADNFLINRFERPFTATTMEYIPDVDIVDFSITSDDKFFYIRISLTGPDPATNSLTGFYGVEIDKNVDGRAEILLATRPPYNTEFSADNVILFIDEDGDIGGTKPSRPDENFSGNGFDAILFDLSQNVHPDDPDLAWSRFIPGDQPAIEIAYKKWLFKDGNESFMWSAWASKSEFNPLSFNLHDNISEEEAGSANKESPLYPIKEIAAIDNTCRVPLGFQAAGNEPLGCSVNIIEPEDDEETEGVEFCDQFPSACGRGPTRPPVVNNSID
jgi:hypothetical protein